MESIFAGAYLFFFFFFAILFSSHFVERFTPDLLAERVF